MRGEGVGDPLRTTAWHRPADRVGEDEKNEAEGGRGRAAEWQHRMCRSSRQERAGPLAAKGKARQRLRREERSQPEPGERDRMSRHVEEWAEDFLLELRPVGGITDR